MSEPLTLLLTPLMSSGTMSNGNCLTAKISESHSIGKESILLDILEKNVDEKYYLSEEQMSKLTLKSKKVGDRTGFNTNTQVFDPTGISGTLDTAGGGGRELHVIEYQDKENKINSSEVKVIGNTSNTNHGGENVYDATGLSPTLKARDYKGPAQIAIAKEEFGRFGRQAIDTYNENDCEPGDTINGFNKTVDKSGKTPTITTRPEGFKTAILAVTDNFRIRKLTPRECWRLQGFPDWAFDKAEKVNSNSQLYKQAGNSVTVNVVYEIAKELAKAVSEEQEK